jgi:hypothetical protein
MPEPPKAKPQKEPGQVGLFALFAFAVGAALVWDEEYGPWLAGALLLAYVSIQVWVYRRKRKAS